MVESVFAKAATGQAEPVEVADRLLSFPFAFRRLKNVPQSQFAERVRVRESSHPPGLTLGRAGFADHALILATRQR
jgi:hypothetical protein